MQAKTKGTRAERELVHKFWADGWTAMRSPGSGSIKYPCPDILAGNVKTNRRLAIECKSTRFEKQYLDNKEIKELKEFSQMFGAESWVGVRFDNDEWYFLMLEDLQPTNGGNYVVDMGLAKRKGLLYEELVKNRLGE